MSELINTQGTERGFRWHLLTTVSALACLASVSMRDVKAADEDADRPTVWIELGGQLEQMSGGQEEFAPPFVANIPSTFFSPLSIQKPLRFSFGGEGSVSFEPEGSDWVFSASALYGRSNGVTQRHQQTPNVKIPVAHFTKFGIPFGPKYYYFSSHVKFENASAQKSEAHAVLDFQAGKDVGLGMFGNRGSSVLSAGIRFAQFVSKSSVAMHAEPDVHYPSTPITNFTGFKALHSATPHFHDYAGMEINQRSFRGIGPSVAWKASAPFVGNADGGEMTLDWGANAALLFGRQKASGHHQTTVKIYHKSGIGAPKNQIFGNAFVTVALTQTSNGAPFNRSRTVIVPNLGGFAGITFRRSIAKISLGYRADLFFGAMDGGIDTARKEDQGFYGPFATISIGLGG